MAAADVIIIGPSGAGKSTLAAAIKAAAAEGVGDIALIEGSQWIRERFQRWDHSPETAAFLAQRSKELLAEDPNIALRAMQNTLSKSHCRPSLVVGLRNPTDFVGLYDPTTTLVVVIAGEPANRWEEEGLSQIMSILGMVKANPIFLPERFWEESYGAKVVELVLDHIN